MIANRVRNFNPSATPADAAPDYNPAGSGLGYDTNAGELIVNPDGTARRMVDKTTTQTLTNKTFTAPVLTTPTIDGAVYGNSDRQLRCKVYALSGATIHAGVVAAFTAPAACIVERVIMDITTVATGACTLDVGYTAASATTTSDTFLDGIDVHAGTGTWDSMNAALDSGANARAQKMASGKWITVDDQTGDATGLVGNLYVFYTLA